MSTKSILETGGKRLSAFVTLRKYEVPVGIDIRRVPISQTESEYSWRSVDVIQANWSESFDSEEEAVKNATEFFEGVKR